MIFRVTYSAQEPTLPLRLQNPYGMTSLKVGLVYIGSSVPTLLCESDYLITMVSVWLMTLRCCSWTNRRLFIRQERNRIDYHNMPSFGGPLVHRDGDTWTTCIAHCRGYSLQ